MTVSLHERLLQLAEPDFQRFTSRLLPGVEPILGVRLPNLRKIAREIARGDWSTYLQEASSGSFEEIMLEGMVIGAIKAPVKQVLPLVTAFVPKIDNWSVCDSFCSSLKLAQKEPALLWDFLAPYFSSNEEFPARFGVVMGLNYYISSSYLPSLLTRLSQVPCEAYYARMAVAWALSLCYLRFPKETLPLLEGEELDDFTHQKTLQKITESRCVDETTKSFIKTLKRSR